jgi:hypothetical protein
MQLKKLEQRRVLKSRNEARLLIIIGIIFYSISIPDSFASCAGEYDSQAAFNDAELAFIGTVISIKEQPRPQLVQFDVHKVLKGNILEKLYILKSGPIRSADGERYTISSIDVDYKIGTTYTVFVIDGQTNICSTKPVDMMKGIAITNESYNVYPMIAVSVVSGIVGLYVWRKRK